MTTDPTALIASGAIVIFLVQQLKRWIPVDFLPLTAVGVGIAVQVLNDLLLGAAQNGASLWASIVTGAAVGMASAGSYDLAGRVGAWKTPQGAETGNP